MEGGGERCQGESAELESSSQGFPSSDVPPPRPCPFCFPPFFPAVIFPEFAAYSQQYSSTADPYLHRPEPCPGLSCPVCRATHCQVSADRHYPDAGDSDDDVNDGEGLEGKKRRHKKGKGRCENEKGASLAEAMQRQYDANAT